MRYTCLVPSEYSIGQTTRREATNKTCNRHVRRAVVEAVGATAIGPLCKDIAEMTTRTKRSESGDLLTSSNPVEREKNPVGTRNE